MKRLSSVFFLLPGIASAADNPIALLEQRGLEIYQRDQAAWHATDAVSMERLIERDAQGWLTVPDEDNWKVRFIGNCEEGVCIIADVVVDIDTIESKVFWHPEGAQLSVSEQQMWRARELAINSNFTRCQERYNTAVLHEKSAEGEVWLVYMLAAQTQSNILMTGGHQRITINNEGTEILANEQIARCGGIEVSENAEMIVTTHSISAYPAETHVFVGLQHNLKMAVVTSTRDAYLVVDGQIELISIGESE